ncbi:hypothetical protein B0F90DRAFT_1728542 [Multifurca ochricompacta]|uniref:Uncharacterized protein n=1 Tax=Multifurca ochricompacta TaxID=376703 RepID=A0AAD4M3U6_9AGAM|nr:hypothetical protein B0F90DRAFT_1728542 [Multifurca ochricompacta]
MAMATPSRPSNASARLRTKTSELSDLFRGHTLTKSKRKIPLFSLRKKSPAPPSSRRSPTPTPNSTPLPTPRPSTNACSLTFATVQTRGQSHLPQLTIPSSSFSPLPTFEDVSSPKLSSTSPTTSRSARPIARTPSSHSPNGWSKSRTPTPTSAVTLSGGSFSDSSHRALQLIPPGKPAPTKSLPPPPEGALSSAELSTPTSPVSPTVLFPGSVASFTQSSSDAKLSMSSGRKLAVSTPRSPSFKFASGSESASESAQGYTSASGSESAATGLGLGFRIRTRSSQGRGNDTGSTTRAASVRVGLLRSPNPFTGSKVASPPSPKSPAISLTKSSPPAFSSSLERTGSLRPAPLSHSSSKRASPPMQVATLRSPSEISGRRQTEPVTVASGAKHASWLVIPKVVPTSSLPGPAGGQDTKVSVPSKSRARAASDSRTLTSVATVSSDASLPASSAVGVSVQSITATPSSLALSTTPPLNFSKSPSTAVSSPSAQANRVGSASSSPPTDPLPKVPRPSLSHASSELSQLSSGPSISSPSSSESSTRTLTIPSILSSTPNTSSASGSGTIRSPSTDSSNTFVSSPSGSTTSSAVKSLPASSSIANGNLRRSGSRDDRPTNKDKSKDSTWPARSASKRSSPTVSSPLVHSHSSPESPPYASPSSFSASTTASSPSPQPPPSRVIVPIPPTPANIFALQTDNADLRAEVASLRAQLETADLQEEVQAAVRYLRAESESGYGSGSASGSQSRMSHSSAYSSVYPAESVSEGSGSEAGIAQRTPFGPGPSARASEDQALDAIPERTVVGDEDTSTTEAERRRKKDERRASRALKRLSASTVSDTPSSGLDEVVAQAMYANNIVHGRALSIEQVIEGDRARRDRVGLKGMDEVLDKLRAVAGVDSGGIAAGVKHPQ